MTCIAGLVHDGIVYMGCDSMGSSDDDAYDAVFPKKVFKLGDFLVGVSGNLRINQLLQYAWEIPERGNMPLTPYIVAVAESIRPLLSDAEESAIVDGAKRVYEGMVMLGYEGKLFRIFSNCAVMQSRQEYATIGSGGNVANGALFATKGMEPKARIKSALQAAETHISSVRGPFTILTLGGDKNAKAKET